MQFDWDPDKLAKNIRKHKIDFSAAGKVFLDPYRVEYDEPDDDDGIRYNTTGMVDGRLMFVTYTMRGDLYRIISARRPDPHEKRRYHEV